MRRFKYRIHCKNLFLHLLVLLFVSSNYQVEDVILDEKKFKKFYICEVSSQNDDEIDQLTSIDPWSIPRESTVDRLKKGWRCFVAKKDHQVIAAVWIFLGQRFEDYALHREFILNSSEAYVYRAVCRDEFRGNSIFPYLLRSCLARLQNEKDVEKFYALTRNTNRSSLRAFEKVGFRMVGWAGFLEIAHIRLHYLWGSESFKEVKTRCFLENLGSTLEYENSDILM